MAWTKPHPLERVAEWGAPLVLALAAAWSASVAGLSLAAKAGGGVVALSVGLIAMRMAGKVPLTPEAGFQPVEFEQDDDDVLLLEDRLHDPAPDSRVVKLFERQEPTPGELVLRISDYLTEQGKPPATDSTFEYQPADASDALHAALANIRATLR
jgi:hypothetical protein